MARSFDQGRKFLLTSNHHPILYLAKQEELCPYLLTCIYYQKLPTKVKDRVDKQLHLLFEDFRHPSLRLKKLGGTDIFEIRITKGYRLSVVKKQSQAVSIAQATPYGGQLPLATNPDCVHPWQFQLRAPT